MERILGQNSVKDTEIALNLCMERIDGYSLQDVDFYAEVFAETGFKTVKIEKETAKRVDNDNYIILVDTALIGAGKYYVRLTAHIPDPRFDKGYRIERRTAYTGVTIDAQ